MEQLKGFRKPAQLFMHSVSIYRHCTQLAASFYPLTLLNPTEYYLTLKDMLKWVC